MAQRSADSSFDGAMAGSIPPPAAPRELTTGAL